MKKSLATILTIVLTVGNVVFSFPELAYAVNLCGAGSSISFIATMSGQCRGYITATGASTFTVPTNWNSSNNKIEVISGGAGGDGLTLPGGGGGYSKITNVSLTAGTSVGYSVGAGGAGGPSGTRNNTWGGGTWFCNSTSNCTTATSSAAIVGIEGGHADGN